jgi:hypothetical protein
MIATLIGSARFESHFHAWNKALSLAGYAVFGLASYPSQNEGVKSWYDNDEKTTMDLVHLQKIQLSDAVLLLNPYAYIGESTLREIQWTKMIGKPLYALESWGHGLGLTPSHTSKSLEKARALFQGDLPRSPIDTSHFLYAPRLIHDNCPNQPRRTQRIIDQLHRDGALDV